MATRKPGQPPLPEYKPLQSGYTAQPAVAPPVAAAAPVAASPAPAVAPPASPASTARPGLNPTTFDAQAVQRAREAAARRAAGTAPTPPAVAQAQPRPSMAQRIGKPAIAGAGIGAGLSILSDAPDTISTLQDPNATTGQKVGKVGETLGRAGAIGTGTGLGTKLGMAAGALTGPAAPIAVPALGLLGGMGGGYVGGRLFDAAMPTPDAPTPQAPQAPAAVQAPPAQAVQPQFQEGQATQAMRNMPGASGELSVAGAPQQDAGSGITRIDTPGQSPLFTNMAAGDPSNVGLMGRGQISAQNMGAADALAARYATPRVQQAQPVGAVTPASTGGFGLLDNNARRERELRMEASSSRNPGESGRAYRARLAGAAADLTNFRQTQNAAPEKAAEQSLASRRLDAENAATSARTGLDVLRMNLDERRAGEEAATGALTREAAQMGINKAKQIEALQQQWQAAGNDPAKQKAIAQQLSVLGSKGEGGNLKDNFMVVGGEQQYDDAGYRISDTPKMLIDLRTMQPVNAGAVAGAAKTKKNADLVAGQAYPRTRNGVTQNYEYLGNGQWSPTPLK